MKLIKKYNLYNRNDIYNLIGNHSNNNIIFNTTQVIS